MRWRVGIPVVAFLLLLLWRGKANEVDHGRRVDASPGVVVETVEVGGAAATAGLQPGDVLSAWERAATPPANPTIARGEIHSPFDLLDLEIEQAPRGALRLKGTRHGQRFTAVLPGGAWHFTVRPRLMPSGLEADQAGAVADPAAWRRLAQAWSRDGHHRLASWLWYRSASGLHQEGAWRQAQEGFERAGKAATVVGAQRVLAWTKVALAEALVRQNDSQQATAVLREALALRRQLVARDDLVVAKILNRLGTLAWRYGDRDGGEAYHRQALAISQREAPGSLAVVVSLDNVGITVGQSGDLDAAVDLFRQALAIGEGVAPGSLQVSRVLRHLGIAARKSGDLFSAAGYFRRALPILEEQAPGGLQMAALYSNLGIVARERGDLALAEEYFRRNLELEQRLNPGSPSLAISLLNVGVVALHRRDLGRAEKYFRDCLAIQERLAPEGRDLASTLGMLGLVAFYRGDLEQAEALKRRALPIWQRIAPESLELASELKDLGSIALERGDLKVAERLYRRTLAIEEEQAPGSLLVASTLSGLGVLAGHRGEVGSAERHHRDALAIQTRLAPESVWVAESWHLLGRLYRRSGRRSEALRCFNRALAAFEAQWYRLGGAYEAKSVFAARHGDLYHEHIALALEVGQVEEAFDILERSRTRAFLEMLAQRDLSYAATLPAALGRARRLANANYDRLLGSLSTAADDGAVAALQRQLREARHQQEEAEAEIRLAAPRLAALRHPEPLGLAAIRELLDPGTLLLSYAVGEDDAFLFAVGPAEAGLAAFSLQQGEEELRAEIERFRVLLSPGQPAEVVRFRAAALTSQLLSPVADRIRAAERLLILPDGPLHHLPFAALLAPEAKPDSPYLVETRPLTMVASATLFKTLRRQRRELGEMRVSAFGDPSYPARDPSAETAGPVLRAALRSGLHLDPVPGTRAEVEGLRALFPDTTQVYLGAEATEEAAKSPDPRSSIFHFACHGMVDERFPLESALVLSIPQHPRRGQDNGLLQAWEIIEQVRIDADLVTLSACDSALGKELGGEGILGLVGAFHYAGARSVLASLWKVNDGSTADLMRRFYRYLAAGESKDAALRRAQVDLIRGVDGAAGYDHPFYWAAFKLIGDWY